jgi:hypothetical protein
MAKDGTPILWSSLQAPEATLFPEFQSRNAKKLPTWLLSGRARLRPERIYGFLRKLELLSRLRRIVSPGQRGWRTAKFPRLSTTDAAANMKDVKMSCAIKYRSDVSVGILRMCTFMRENFVNRSDDFQSAWRT